MNKNINIPGRLHSVATDGQVAGANEIYDDEQQKFQGEINAELHEDIEDAKEVVDSFDDRVKAIEDLAEISIEGGEVQVANTAEEIVAGSGKVPTANALNERLTSSDYVDDEPVAGSDKSVKSGGVSNYTNLRVTAIVSSFQERVSVVGDIVVHTGNKRVYKVLSVNSSGIPQTWNDWPLSQNAIYICDNNTYIYDGSTLKRSVEAPSLDSVNEIVEFTDRLTPGGYYNSELVLIQQPQCQSCEIDVTNYQGKLLYLDVRALGPNIWCGFVDEDGNVLLKFNTVQTGMTSTIIIPIPREIDLTYQDGSVIKGAKYLRVSNWDTYTTPSIKIVNYIADKRLQGKNIACVGHSVIAPYYNAAVHTNLGWWLYMLAPLFGYNIVNKAKGGTTWMDSYNYGVANQFIDCLTWLNDSDIYRKSFDLILCFTGPQSNFAVWSDSYENTSKASFQEMRVDDSATNVTTQTKGAIKALKNIIKRNPHGLVYLYTPLLTSANGDWDSEENPASCIHRIHYQKQILPALADAFNCHIVNVDNNARWRVWTEYADRYYSSDCIHADTIYGGYEMFRAVFSEIWNSLSTEQFIGGYKNREI